MNTFVFVSYTDANREANLNLGIVASHETMKFCNILFIFSLLLGIIILGLMSSHL